MLKLRLLCIFIFFCCSVSHAEERRVFSINTSDSPPYSTKENSGLYDRIITRLFAKIDLPIRINHLPSARSIENVELGLDDGEYARIRTMGEHYKNLVIVDEKLIDYQFTAFSKDPSLTLSGWEDLAQFHVAYIRGWKIYETNVKHARSILQVSSEEKLFQLLEKDRVEIVLYELLRGVSYVKRNGVPDVVPLKRPLSVRGMYLYLNEKHRNLIEPLQQGLREMKKNSEYTAIIQDYIE